MKRFLKVRLLPICLLLILLFQAIPVTAHGSKTLSLGTRYVSEERLYGLITPDFSVSHLYYDQLENDIQRNIFDDICCASPEYSSFQVTLTDLPEFTIEGNSLPQEVQDALLAYVDSFVLPAYAAAFLDNPLLFWASGVSYSVDISLYGTLVTEITVTCMLKPFGGYTDESYEETLSVLEERFLSLPLSEDSNPYEWMKFFHDYLCETVVYVESTNSHNIIGPLLEGKSVCEGYAKSFKIFCELLEIPSAVVIGVGNTSSGSEAHAWNVVRMEDGNWYAVDVTWDDQDSGIYYDFFLVGGETVPTYFNPITFNQSHVANGDFFGTGEVILISPALHPTAYDPADAHTHVYEAEITYPTCTEGGYTTYTCACGDSYTDDYADPTGHNYTEWEVETFPTCQGSGTLRRECLTCGLEDKIFSTPADHQYEAVVTEPTCTGEGYTTYTCPDCGEFYVDDVLPATGHDYQAVVTAPTCTEEGYTTYTCHCGDSYVDDEVPATGHTWEDIGIIPPGCEGNGWTTYVCTLCGKTKTVQKEPVYDADGNGAVDQADLILLMSVLVGNAEADTLYDFDFDGKLTVYDCVLLMQQIS